MMKNRAKVIKKIEICKQMPILLSINKNYFHYSNIPKTAKKDRLNQATHATNLYNFIGCHVGKL